MPCSCPRMSVPRSLEGCKGPINIADRAKHGSVCTLQCAHIHLIRCKASKSCRAEDVRVVPVFDELVQTLAACNPGLLSWTPTGSWPYLKHRMCIKHDSFDGRLLPVIQTNLAYCKRLLPLLLTLIMTRCHASPFSTRKTSMQAVHGHLRREVRLTIICIVPFRHSTLPRHA